MDASKAEDICNLMMMLNANLDQSVAFIQENSSQAEFEHYRGLVGQAMGRVVDILEYIYDKHPDLRPQQVGGSYEVDPQVFKNLLI